MLKSYLKYSFSILAAIYFVFAGTGYNVVQFCCDDCASEGIDFIVHHSCAAVHHDKEHDCCDLDNNKTFEFHHESHIQTCTHNNGCQVIRVQLDEFSLENEIINTNTSFSDLFVENCFVNTLNGHLIDSDVILEYSPPSNLLSLSGREILSNKSVLVI